MDDLSYENLMNEKPKTVKLESTEIKRLLALRHTEDFFACEVKNGQTWGNDGLVKFDALAIKKSWSKPCFVGYEIKTSRGDFKSDDKWPYYLQYVHKFYWVCPEGLIKKEEIDKTKVGLMYVKDGSIRTVVSAPMRMVDINPDLLMYIIFSKLKSDRYPFHNSRVDYFNDWLQHYEERANIGYQVSSKLIDELRKTQDELRKTQDNAMWIESKYKSLEETAKNNNQQILGSFLRAHKWNIERCAEFFEILKKLSKQGVERND